MADNVIRKTIRKILIANYGEIAVRVIRTCRDLDIQTVSVCSESDSGSPHARLADETVMLEGKTTAETCLNGKLLLDVVVERGVDAGRIIRRNNKTDSCILCILRNYGMNSL